MKKLLSIIIPLYNSAKWLPKCLDSVLDQDIPLAQLEVICINDGSPDNSADIVKEYQRRYPETIVLLNQENQGPSGARNNGMQHATGKYMCFVDPDDYVSSNVYGSLLKQMEEEELDAIRFDYYTENEQYQEIQEVAHPFEYDYTPQLMTGAEFMATRLHVACYIWTYIFRRSIITDNKIWCYTGDYFDDTPWLPLVLLQVQRMNITPTKVLHYIIRADSLVHAKSPKMIERKMKGAIFVQEKMQEQLASITDEGVREWYRMTMSNNAFGLLTMAAIYRYDESKHYIRLLKQYKVFPLSTRMASLSAARKMTIANISPWLYCKIMHYIHK